MKLHLGVDRKRGGRLCAVGAIGGAALVAAVLPVSAVLALAFSGETRQALAARFVPGKRVADVSRRLSFAWMAGFVLLMVGQATEGVAGPMSMLNPAGLAAHTLFGMCDEVVMAAATILILRRGRSALPVPIDG